MVALETGENAMNFEEKMREAAALFESAPTTLWTRVRDLLSEAASARNDELASVVASHAAGFLRRHAAVSPWLRTCLAQCRCQRQPHVSTSRSGERSNDRASDRLTDRSGGHSDRCDFLRWLNRTVRVPDECANELAVFHAEEPTLRADVRTLTGDLLSVLAVAAWDLCDDDGKEDLALDTLLLTLCRLGLTDMLAAFCVYTWQHARTRHLLRLLKDTAHFERFVSQLVRVQRLRETRVPSGHFVHASARTLQYLSHVERHDSLVGLADGVTDGVTDGMLTDMFHVTLRRTLPVSHVRLLLQPSLLPRAHTDLLLQWTRRAVLAWATHRATAHLVQQRVLSEVCACLLHALCARSLDPQYSSREAALGGKTVSHLLSGVQWRLEGTSPLLRQHAHLVARKFAQFLENETQLELMRRDELDRLRGVGEGDAVFEWRDVRAADLLVRANLVEVPADTADSTPAVESETVEHVPVAESETVAAADGATADGAVDDPYADDFASDGDSDDFDDAAVDELATKTDAEGFSHKTPPVYLRQCLAQLRNFEKDALQCDAALAVATALIRADAPALTAVAVSLLDALLRLPEGSALTALTARRHDALVSIFVLRPLIACKYVAQSLSDSERTVLERIALVKAMRHAVLELKGSKPVLLADKPESDEWAPTFDTQIDTSLTDKSDLASDYQRTIEPASRQYDHLPPAQRERWRTVDARVAKTTHFRAQAK
ncbi:MAG: hypothetical protein MHM6MM_006641, partial [Cercozoa sp. M6MM]